MTEWARNVRTPDGRAFTIFLGAPGSTLDSDEFSLGNLRGGFFGLVAAAAVFLRSLFRASASSWRLAVNEIKANSHLGPALYRERGMDRATAEARSAELGQLISSGGWDPATRHPPPQSQSGDGH